jgi:hypothetical protein
VLALGACEECISNAVRARVSAPYCTFEAARSSTRRPATLCLSCSAPLTVEGAHRTAPWRYQVKRRRSEAAWGMRRGSDWCVRERRPRSPRPAAGRAARGFCDEPCSILRRREFGTCHSCEGYQSSEEHYYLVRGQDISPTEISCQKSTYLATIVLLEAALQKARNPSAALGRRVCPAAAPVQRPRSATKKITPASFQVISSSLHVSCQARHSDGRRPGRPRL